MKPKTYLVTTDREGNQVELDLQMVGAINQGISSMQGVSSVNIEHPEDSQERQTDRKQHANQANSNSFLSSVNAWYVKERENALNAASNTRTLADEAYNIRKNRNEEAYQEGRRRTRELLSDHLEHMHMLGNAANGKVIDAEQVTSAGEESIRKGLEVGLAAALKVIQEIERTPDNQPSGN